MRDLRLICAVSMLAVFGAANAFSQAVNATLVGSVTDSTGAAVANAKVTITETDTGIVHALNANGSGNFTQPDLPPGIYAVSAEQPGFKREERKGIVLLANTSIRVDIQLQPGNVSETIEVTGAPPVLQTDRADIGRVLDSQIVEEMPLGANRNFQSLLDLVPGTAPETFQHSQFFNASSSLQTEVNGQPRHGNNYQIEGIDDNEHTGLLQILIPPAEAIQTVGISTNNHDPELGRSTGAVINVMLKSGTNRFHGAAYEYLQNSEFNSRTFFNPGVGHLVYNYFGGNIGGPIKKNKLFFFSDYLRTADHEANTNQESIPSGPFHTGDLSGDPSHQVYDPATGNATTGVGRTPFPGNIIPSSRINPVSAAIIALLPAPNETFSPTVQTNDYYALLPFHKDTNFIDSKMDWNIDDKSRLSVRFSFQDPTIFQAPIFGNAGGPAQSAFAGTGNQRTFSTGINYNRVITPTLLTEVRVGVAYYNNVATQADYGKNDSTAIGVKGVNLDLFTSGFVGIDFSNTYTQPTTGYSASLPWTRAEANIDFVNSWTKTWHNHTIKWGVDIRRVRDALLQDQTYSPRGIVYFGLNQTSIPGASTGLANEMASFLLDVPYQEGRDVNTYFPALRETQYFAYAADNWQVTPKLTVNMGLRWEYYAPPTPQFAGGFSNYNFVNQTLVIAGVGGNPSDLGMKKDLHNFAPRIGIAYRVNEKTVIRTGFGISYTPFPDNSWAYNFPVRSNNIYTSNGNSYAVAVLPGGAAPTWQNGFPAPDPVVVPSNGIITNPNPTTQEFVIPLNWKNPYVEQWNFAIQRQLPSGFNLDVAYVGSHGVDTPAEVDLNAGQVIGAGNAGEPLYAQGITAPINQFFQGFSSTYHALQVKLDRQYIKGFRVTTSFTWQKAMDFMPSDDGSLDFYAGQGLSRNYARADFDRTLNFIQSYIWDLPVGQGHYLLSQGPVSKVVGGWKVSGILSWRTGTPITVTSTSTLNLGQGGTVTAQQVAPVTYPGGINVGHPWFSTSSFVKTANNVQGNSGRNVFSGPDLFTLNLSLSRTFQIREKMNFQLRAETFNLTNTPGFSNPNAQVGSTNYGFITTTLSSGTGVNSGAGGGRVLQLAAKFTF